MSRMTAFFSSYAGKLLLLIGLYIVTGKMGLMLAVPPGYATVIWPPSGIALGMLIMHGRRLWPGILIGSFLLNAYIGDAYSWSGGIVPEKLLSAFGIALGSTLQALVGYTLVRRFIGIPLHFDAFRKMLKLFVLCGPVSCLIAATVGMAVLYASGVLPADKLADNWLAWWTGDVFGILVFLPVMLVAPGSPNRLIWRGTVVSSMPVMAMLVLILPLGLTFYAWKLAAEGQYQKAQAEFSSLAIESEKALLHRLDSYENALLGGAGFFQGSTHVSRDEWRDYVRTIQVQDYFPGINGLGWVADVPSSTLDRFLAEARADEVPEFTIHPPTEGRPHFVITYIEPFDHNQQALGLNIAFEDNRLEAATLSRDTGKPAITKRIVLVQDEHQTPGFLLLHPLYRHGTQPATPDERREALRGWIYAPFIAKNFLHSLTRSQGEMFDLRIYDGEQENPNALIYSSNGGTLNADSSFTQRKVLHVMQQKWLIIWNSTAEYERTQGSDNPLFILVGGLLFTALFGLFMMVLAVRRVETIEWISGERKYALPLVIFVVLSAGSYALYHTLTQKELNYVQKLIEDEANKIELLLTTQTESKLLALRRMAERWNAANGTPQHLWRRDAYNYTQDLIGLNTVEWVDSSYHVRWAEPTAGNEKVIGLNILFDAQREKALRGAAERKTPTLTPPLRLVQGYDAFIAYLPLSVHGRFDGFMAGIFSISEFFGGQLSKEVADNFAVSLSYAGKDYFTYNTSPQGDSDWAVSRTLRIYDKDWNIRIMPTQQFVASEQTALPNLILIAGLIIAALSALSVRSILIARLRAGYLAQSNRNLIESQNAISKAVEGISRIDTEGRYVIVNNAYAATAGYSPEELVGKPWSVTVDPTDLLHLRRAYAEMLKTGKVVAEARGVKKDGSLFFMRVTMISQYDADGAFIGHHSFMQDISERKLQEQALRTSEETFRSAIENASIGMALVAPSGRFLEANQALCDMLGYEKWELLQSDFQSITYADDLEADLEYVQKVIADEIKTYRMEKRYIHKSGRLIWIQLSVSLVRTVDGEPHYFIAQIQDITEQKEMDRIKSEFISIVSHELRTPLTSIRGSLGLVLGALAKDLPEKVKGLIGIAHSNCERLILLINDILDIDKIASGQMRFDMKEESLAAITQEAVNANEAYAEKFCKGIVLDRIDAGLQIRVDAARYVQVLSNLLSNAAKFSPAESTVGVGIMVRDGWVRVTVADEGPGIPEEFRSRIFGKFSQADSSSTRGKGGTGLGLHIAKQMVEHMQGRIGFESELGKGTRFWVEFPLVQTLALPSDPVDESRPAVLICEDDRALASLFAAMLSNAGFQADVAHNLAEARERLAVGHYVAMTLDSILPDGAGADFIREVRGKATTEHLPIIVIAGNEPEASDGFKPSEYQVTAWLKKPIEEKELVAEVNEAMQALPAILHIEDDTDLIRMLATALHGKAHVIAATTLRGAENMLRQRAFSLIVLDLGMPDGSGLTIIDKVPELSGKPVPIVILSADLPQYPIRGKIAAIMEKSRVSETKVVETILEILEGEQHER